MKIFIYCLLIFIYSCSEKPNYDKKIKNQYYDKAWFYFDKGEKVKSFIEFEKAKNHFLKEGDSLGVAKCLMNMSIIMTDQGDYFGGQETSLEANKFFNENNKSNHTYIGANYNNLGIASFNLKNYKEAEKFYNLAIWFSDTILDTQIYLNNKALLLQNDKNYQEAIIVYNQLFQQSHDNKIEYSRALSNLSRTRWLLNNNYNPLPEFRKALLIRFKEHDSIGLNASYSHLADYYIKNNQDSALFYARKMYEVSKEIKSPDDQVEALQKLISLEDENNSKKYFKVYQKLDDSLQTARNKAKNQFALIRYETEKNKADFLKAQAESTEKHNKIIVRNIIVVALVIFLLFGYLYYTRRQKRLKQEKELEVKNTELKYSKKVHDKVANRIYQLMSQVENKSDIDRDSLIFGLENVYETSRDISYDNKDVDENKIFSEQLQNMLNSYQSSSVNVIFNGNKENIWENVSFQNKTEIYLILQELMTNMKKHSQADKVFLKFSKEKNIVNISYTDNGIGMKNHLPKNGLQNMENRILVIHGKINFDSETNNLLKINISFPI